MSSSTLPPSYFDLTTFGIGTKKIKRPLVTIAQVKPHLRLLRAFKLFQEKVEDLYSDPEVADVVPPIARSVGAKGRWLWFLEMAVERSVYYSRLVWSIFFLCAHLLCGDDCRFRLWLSALEASKNRFITPPVDVWLIWHAYMLNPMSVPELPFKSPMLDPED